ncbi:hypothetical protein KY285_020768 [Solanum tuberosum]|nr:hypothetical protein KY285_020768 [Solanum tuberosum]
MLHRSEIILSEAFLIQDCPGERNDLGMNFCFPYELPRPVVKHGIARAHFLVAQLNREDATCLIAAFNAPKSIVPSTVHGPPPSAVVRPPSTFCQRSSVRLLRHLGMANNRYEYVKWFEVEDEVMYPNITVVQIDGCDFGCFSEKHGFEKPNDDKDLNLMNACAIKDLSVPPSFHSRVINCASMEVLQAYLLWRQIESHISNQYNTCLWKLVFSRKSEKEAKEILKGTQKQEQNELLFQQFGINYKDLPQIFHQGSCAIKIKVDDIVKYHEDDTHVKRPRKKAVIVHSENVATNRFWNNYTCLTEELGSLAEGINKIKPEYLRSFQFESRLMLSTWIVVRVDGCHFHRFCEDNGFQKPNDEQALKFMNSCAVSLLEMFKDIIFAYGVSDEYSFVLKKDSLLYQRWSSEIVSAVVSLFSSMYVMKWKEFFHKKEFKEPPYFDGRSVCYPSSEILRDYLAWRQVDCHINNQYNTCFWLLVKSG